MGRNRDHKDSPSLGRTASGGGIVLGTLTHVGMVRSSNQDAYCALLAPNAPPGVDALLAVADGMGGHQAGDVASGMAIQEIVSRLGDRTAATGTTSPDAYLSRLAQAVQEANTAVYQAGTRPELRGMGTTLTATLLMGRTLLVGHVGDSRAYLLRPSPEGLQQLTRDHSWVAEQVEAGALSADEARGHPYRNLLTRALGTDAQVKVDTGQLTLRDGDTLVLCSDGLHGLVEDEEIARIAAAEEPQKAAQALVDLANTRGGQDNITVVIARVVQGSAGAVLRGKGAGTGQTRTVQLQRPAGGSASGGVRLARLLLLALWMPLKLLLKALWLLLRTSWEGLRALGRLLLRSSWEGLRVLGVRRGSSRQQRRRRKQRKGNGPPGGDRTVT